jgi:hypothetical protein
MDESKTWKRGVAVGRCDGYGGYNRRSGEKIKWIERLDSSFHDNLSQSSHTPTNGLTGAHCSSTYKLRPDVVMRCQYQNAFNQTCLRFIYNTLRVRESESKTRFVMVRTNKHNHINDTVSHWSSSTVSSTPFRSFVCIFKFNFFFQNILSAGNSPKPWLCSLWWWWS